MMRWRICPPTVALRCMSPASRRDQAAVLTFLPPEGLQNGLQKAAYKQETTNASHNSLSELALKPCQLTKKSAFVCSRVSCAAVTLFPKLLEDQDLQKTLANQLPFLRPEN